MLRLNFLVRFLTMLCFLLSNQNSFGQSKSCKQPLKIPLLKKNTKTFFGQASFYSKKFEGKKTASGQIFNHKKFTAACNTLPLGTFIKVTNLRNGKAVIVQTNDRLHVKTKRLIDLTSAGAKKLGFVAAGLTRVKVEVLAGKNVKNETKNNTAQL